MTDLSNPEKAALAELNNAMTELRALVSKSIPAQFGPADMAMLMGTINELQVSFNALVEVLLMAPLVGAALNPAAPPDDPAAVPVQNPDGTPKQAVSLDFHPFRREMYWRACAAQAAAKAALIRRTMLAAGGQGIKLQS